MSQLAKVTESFAENLKNARKCLGKFAGNLQLLVELINSQNPANVGGGKGLSSLAPGHPYNPKTLDEAES